MADATRDGTRDGAAADRARHAANVFDRAQGGEAAGGSGAQGAVRAAGARAAPARRADGGWSGRRHRAAGRVRGQPAAGEFQPRTEPASPAQLRRLSTHPPRSVAGHTPAAELQPRSRPADAGAGRGPRPPVQAATDEETAAIAGRHGDFPGPGWRSARHARGRPATFLHQRGRRTVPAHQRRRPSERRLPTPVHRAQEVVRRQGRRRDGGVAQSQRGKDQPGSLRRAPRRLPLQHRHRRIQRQRTTAPQPAQCVFQPQFQHRGPRQAGRRRFGPRRRRRRGCQVAPSRQGARRGRVRGARGELLRCLRPGHRAHREKLHEGPGRHRERGRIVRRGVTRRRVTR
mmetsp:Transcript_1756/g.6648  ORF Transcript_1756/g.6648 Transcript_1756/m.6648 type:complete len:344 (+) Transcript_1756:575-1606(+)